MAWLYEGTNDFSYKPYILWGQNKYVHNTTTVNAKLGYFDGTAVQPYTVDIPDGALLYYDATNDVFTLLKTTDTLKDKLYVLMDNLSATDIATANTTPIEFTVYDRGGVILDNLLVFDGTNFVSASTVFDETTWTEIVENLVAKKQA